MFLLYNNDIYKCSSEFTLYLVAGDTSIIYANKDLHTLESTVSLELAKGSERLKANKLTLNVQKYNYVNFALVKRLCFLFLKLRFLTPCQVYK